MELREYYNILKKNASLVFTTALIFVVVVYAWSVREAQKYSAELLLDIGRNAVQNTQDYRYDQFYQTQADEKFAQNIEAWLKFPGIVSEIFSKAEMASSPSTLNQLSRSFSAEAISPESVMVKFNTDNENDAKKISAAVGSVVSEKTIELNNQAKDPSWFKVSSSNLIILKNTQDLRINLSLGILAGLIVGSFLAFLKYYLYEPE